MLLRALFLGLFDGPPRSEELRGRLRSLAERRGREFLHRLLQRLDPAIAARIEPRDMQKTVRALEVCIVARTPISKMQERGRRGLEGYHVIKLGLHPERTALYQRIDRRVEWMFARGLVEETRALLAREKTGTASKPSGHWATAKPARWCEENRDLPEAILQTQVATRRYAKRQMTWFRHEAGIIWLTGFGDDPRVQTQVINLLHAAGIAARCNGRL